MTTLANFEPLKPAEQILLDSCTSGVRAVISDARPTEETDINTIRGAFIRWLVTNGNASHQLHAHGVRLSGAWILGLFDLESALINSDLFLNLCCFVVAPNLRGTKLNGNLSFGGTLLENGLMADGAQISGGVSLRIYESIRFESLGPIFLRGTKIGGDLSCIGAKIKVQNKQYAISADQANINGSVYLRYNPDTDTCFESCGEVRFLGAKIGGNFECDGAKLIALKGQYALNADNMQVAGSLFLRDKFESSGPLILIAASIKCVLAMTSLEKPIDSIDVSHCKVGMLEADLQAWGKSIELDGFIYGALRGADWQSNDYLCWLEKQIPKHFGTINQPQNFKPQPWQQLISVLRQMGHNDEARDIAIAFEKRRYEIGKVNGWWKRRLHWVFGILAGYGYKPLNLVGWILAIWLSFAACFWWAAYQGVFTPSDPLVFQNAAYDTCRSVDAQGKNRDINNAEPDGKTNNWYTCGRLMGEYTTFSPLTYSLDVILPLVDLGQEKTWGIYIDTAKPNAVYELSAFTPNHIIRLMVWLEILFGWMASLMLVAVLTGLTDRNKQ